MSYDEQTNAAAPWTFQDEFQKGRTGYYSPIFKEDLGKVPPHWLTPVKRELSSKFKDKKPILGNLDAHSNVFTPYHDDDDETGTLMPAPLASCPSCRTDHSGGSEYAK